jgi:ubiquinone/menaquinone biosynthesis C-methylase UbiE
LLKGKLGLAPVEKPRRVLDLGTGTGIWAIEFGEYIAAVQTPSLKPLPSLRL